MKTYAYFFTRQDLSPEQQIVQTAHAALQLGVNSQRWTKNEWSETVQQPHLMPDLINAADTHFTVVGVRNLDALNAVEEILNKFGFRYEVFFEPDLGAGENTSIAVYPIVETARGPLLAFNLLSINRR
jgi:hypothetical protein